jgi:hypothetical protein
MSRFRRPQQSVISGLGVAGAVLAAVVVTFTVASGIVAYSLTSEDPLVTRSGHTLVLDPLRSAKLDDAPLVLRPAAATSPARRRSLYASQAPGAATLRGAADGALSSTRGGGRAALGTQLGAGGSSTPLPVAGQIGQALRKPVGQALGETTHAVGAKTGTLGRQIKATTVALKAGTEAVVQDAGVAVGSAVDRTGTVVQRLLGQQPVG